MKIFVKHRVGSLDFFIILDYNDMDLKVMKSASPDNGVMGICIYDML